MTSKSTKRDTSRKMKAHKPSKPRPAPRTVANFVMGGDGLQDGDLFATTNDSSHILDASRCTLLSDMLA